MEKELSLAIFACLQAAKVVREIYETPFSINWKGEDDPLTEADLQANRIIIHQIEKNFPEDSILSEEITDSKSRLFKDRVWILDPIDGTREFITKNPEFSVSLGLSVQNKAVLGVVINPISRELFYGVVGLGIGYELLDEDYSFNYDNVELKKPYFLSKEFSKPNVLVSKSEFSKYKLFDKDPFWKSRYDLYPIGSIAYKLALTAVGKAHFTISLKPKSEWDICAGVALIESASGISIDLIDQKEFSFNKENPYDQGILAGNKDYIQELLKTHKEFLRNSFTPHND